MIRTAIDQFLVVVGVVIIIVPVALVAGTGGTFILVLAGVLMVALGVWRLGHRVMPNRRVYVGLRSEVNNFMRLIRKLNGSALVGDQERVNELKLLMHESVERMATFAGIPEDQEA